ncbi:hypothetical protein Mapa_017807 [Marchantia paleacea]|nr:hypothetical protein Mapa_017807 [Marchantia paleacea]
MTRSTLLRSTYSSCRHPTKTCSIHKTPIDRSTNFQPNLFPASTRILLHSELPLSRNLRTSTSALLIDYLCRPGKARKSRQNPRRRSGGTRIRECHHNNGARRKSLLPILNNNNNNFSLL